MWPYLTMTLVALAGGLVLGEWKKSKVGMEILYWGCCVAMIVIAGLRNPYVGGDTMPYRGYFGYVASDGIEYLTGPWNTYRWEPGYGAVNFLISKFTADPQVFLAAVAALTIGLRFLAMRRASSKLWLSLFIYASFGFFSYSLCTLRQELGITVYFFAFPFLQKKKPVPYFLLTALAASFHRTLWILIPVYFLAWIPWKRWSQILYGAGTALLLLLAVPVIHFLAERFAPAYLVDTQFFEGRNIQTAFIPILVCVFTIFMQKRLLERDPRNLVLLNFSVYFAALFAVTLEVFLFQRVALLFFPFVVYLGPELMGCLDAAPEDFGLGVEIKGKGRGKELAQRRKEYKDARALYVTALGLFIAAALLYQVFLLTANRLGLVPYRTFF